MLCHLKFLKILFFVFFIIAYGGSISIVQGISDYRIGLVKDSHKLKKIAFFPLTNLSEDFDATPNFTAILEEELKRKGFELVTIEKLDAFFNKRRIRDTSTVYETVALDAKRELGVDAILLGSIDQSSEIGGEIYAGISLRLIEPLGCSIIWMDSISYAGSDFTGILGLGKVKSLDELSRKVVKEITKDIPHQYRLKWSNINFFTLKKLKINPGITGAGEDIKLSAKIKSLDGKAPALVRARINGKLFDLEGKGENYNGLVKAPMEEGHYSIDIAVFGIKGEVCYFYSAGEIGIDMNGPVVKITTNKNTLKGLFENKWDKVIFTLVVNEPVKKWEVKIMDENGECVREETSYGYLPRMIAWKGQNQKRHQSPDGIYTLHLSTWDKSGNLGITKKKVRLDSTPPKIKMDTEFERENNEVIFSFDYQKNEEIKKWNLQVFNKDSLLIQSINGEGNMEDQIKVPLPELGKASAPSMVLFSFSAIDLAGNEFQTTGQKLLLAKKDTMESPIKTDQKEPGWGVSDF